MNNKLYHTLNKTVNTIYYGHITSNISETNKYLHVEIKGKNDQFILKDHYNNIDDIRTIIQDKDSLFTNMLCTQIKQKSKITTESYNIFEILYDLNDIEDASKYKNRKKYKVNVLRPLRIVNNMKLTMEYHDTLIYTQEHEDFLYKWFNQKYDRGVHRITFPRRRYIRCFEMSSSISGLKAFIIRNIAGEIVCMRSFLLDGEYAYGMSFICDLDINRLSNGVGIWTYRYMLNELGIKYFNTGQATGKLKHYKMHHPHTELVLERFVVKNNISFF
jgi:hypothetical protein